MKTPPDYKGAAELMIYALIVALDEPLFWGAAIFTGWLILR